MNSHRGVASCRGHRSALSPCPKPRTHLQHVMLMSHKYKKRKQQRQHVHYLHRHNYTSCTTGTGRGPMIIREYPTQSGTLVPIARVCVCLDGCAYVRGRTSSSTPQMPTRVQNGSNKSSGEFIPLPCRAGPGKTGGSGPPHGTCACACGGARRMRTCPGAGEAGLHARSVGAWASPP